MEAINQVLPHFHGNQYNRTDVYRKCIEKGILRKDLIAPTTFYRWVREYDLLKKSTTENKRRLAFAMQYANQAQKRSLCITNPNAWERQRFWISLPTAPSMKGDFHDPGILRH